MSGKKASKKKLTSTTKVANTKAKTLKPKKTSTGVRKTKQTAKKKRPVGVIIGIAAGVVILLIILFGGGSGGRRQEYTTLKEIDVNGMTIVEACTAIREAGWRIGEVVNDDYYSDKSDCSDDTHKVSKAFYNKEKYWEYDGEPKSDYETVDLYYSDETVKEQKKLACEAEGKWYRNDTCKTPEEWENDYAWQNAHAACKKYGSNGYAKTLTDCYVGGEYKGPVDGQSTDSSSSSGSSSSTNTSFREAIDGYEKFMNKYAEFLKKYKNASGSELSSMMSDYSDMVRQYSEWSSKIQKYNSSNLSTDDYAYYLEVTSRVLKKLSEVQ